MQPSSATVSLPTFKTGVLCSNTLLPLTRTVHTVQFQHPHGPCAASIQLQSWGMVGLQESEGSRVRGLRGCRASRGCWWTSRLCGWCELWGWVVVIFGSRANFFGAKAAFWKQDT